MHWPPTNSQQGCNMEVALNSSKGVKRGIQLPVSVSKCTRKLPMIYLFNCVKNVRWFRCQILKIITSVSEIFHFIK